MLAEYTTEEIAAALDAAARDAIAQAEIAGPPVDAFAVARAMGIQVARDDTQQGRARYLRLGGTRARPPVAAILLKEDPRPERRHWAVAHEIGEHVAVHIFRALAVDPRITGPRAREQVANQFAGRLLVPQTWLVEAARACDSDLFGLKRRFVTASHELIARRQLEGPPPAIVTIVDQGRTTSRLWNRPGRPPPLAAEEARCQRRASASGEPAEEQSSAGRLRVWPIHEAGWKREISRLELPEYETDTT